MDIKNNISNLKFPTKGEYIHPPNLEHLNKSEYKNDLDKKSLKNDKAHIVKSLQKIALHDEGLSKINISINKDDKGEIYFVIKDKETGEVIREIPDGEVRKLRDMIDDYLEKGKPPTGLIFKDTL